MLITGHVRIAASHIGVPGPEVVAPAPLVIDGERSREHDDRMDAGVDVPATRMAWLVDEVRGRHLGQLFDLRHRGQPPARRGFVVRQCDKQSAGGQAQDDEAAHSDSQRAQGAHPPRPGRALPLIATGAHRASRQVAFRRLLQQSTPAVLRQVDDRRQHRCLLRLASCKEAAPDP